MGEGVWKTVGGMGDLEKEFEEEEIKKVVWDLGPDKATSPDSFLIFFFRIFWQEIKRDLKWLLDEVFRGEAKLDRINFFIITLILKKASPEQIGDYKLIALLNSNLKIVSKILVNPLASKLDTFVEDY